MCKRKTFIVVSVSFDGLHNWNDANTFLKQPHHHRFHVRLTVETVPGDNSRSLEFFEVKEQLLDAIDKALPERGPFGTRLAAGHSTESLSDLIYEHLPCALKERHINIAVMEDETQGSETVYLPAVEIEKALPITQDEIRRRVRELGEQITAEYQSIETLTVVCLLKGAFLFAADLVREIEHPALQVEFIRLKSYSGTEQGDLEVIGPVPDVTGKHVLLVEDICDTGNTLDRATSLCQEAGAASVRVAVLLERSYNEIPVKADYCGFKLRERDFVCGYGLDVNERLRNLSEIRKAC